jgi:hypothetical protein
MVIGRLRLQQRGCTPRESQRLLDWKGDWRKLLELRDYSIKRGFEISVQRRKLSSACSQTAVVKKHARRSEAIGLRLVESGGYCLGEERS